MASTDEPRASDPDRTTPVFKRHSASATPGGPKKDALMAELRRQQAKKVFWINIACLAIALGALIALDHFYKKTINEWANSFVYE